MASLIVLDITRLLSRVLQRRLPTGVDRVGLAYVTHFRNRARALVRFAGRWVVLGQDDSRRVFDALLAPEAEFSWEVGWRIGRAILFSWGIPSEALLVNTGHSGLDRPDYAERVRRLGLRSFFFLHDLIPITHPEYGRPHEADRHHRRLSAMLSVGQGLGVNSECTLRELSAYATARDVSVPPCVVAPLAPALLPPSSDARPILEAYFVVLGTIEPRKNHLLLLHLWREFTMQMQESAPRLVVIGQRGWECEQVVDLLERCDGLREVVIELPRCSDAELSTWLRHAQALLFPSFVEGFGIPLVEALSVGTPVLASNLEVFREIAGDIPEYLGPLDGAAWRDAILNYAEPDSLRRQAQVARMARFIQPTWEVHFEKVEALLRGISD